MPDSSWLDSHFNLEARAGKVEGLSLDRAKKLSELLGNPSRQYPSIHITGTNGKGSTAHILSLLLKSQGLKVGTYISPHVMRLNERFQINGSHISDMDLNVILGELEDIENEYEKKSKLRFSWFELATTAALVWFAKESVDVAIIEVGKLGRYDATNIIDAEVCIVTNISKDHTDGGKRWRQDIAWEKAGIINSDCKLILGVTQPDLRDIFLSEGPAQTYIAGEDFDCTKNQKTTGGRKLDLANFAHTPTHDGSEYKDIFLSLHGAHQGQNASLALAGAKAFLGSELSHETVSEAFSQANLPGRFEVLSEQPLIIVDGAHNPVGAKTARQALDDFLNQGTDYWQSSTLIFATTEEKSITEMLSSLGAKTFSRVICTNLDIPRGKDASQIAQIGQEMGINTEVIESPSEALLAAMDSSLVFICGSLYLVGEVRRTFESQKLEGERINF